MWIVNIEAPPRKLFGLLPPPACIVMSGCKYAAITSTQQSQVHSYYRNLTCAEVLYLNLLIVTQTLRNSLILANLSFDHEVNMDSDFNNR